MATLFHSANTQSKYDRRFVGLFLEELQRRKCPAYPHRHWFAALAAADRVAPCHEPPPAISRAPLGSGRVDPAWSILKQARRRFSDQGLMTELALASEHWLRKYGRL